MKIQHFLLEFRTNFFLCMNVKLQSLYTISPEIFQENAIVFSLNADYAHIVAAFRRLVCLSDGIQMISSFVRGGNSSTGGINSRNNRGNFLCRLGYVYFAICDTKNLFIQVEDSIEKNWKRTEVKVDEAIDI